MARNRCHLDPWTPMDPPEIPKGTPRNCEICGDQLEYQDRISGKSVCPRCDEALSVTEFCSCEVPDMKRMIVPECCEYEPFFRCLKCGRLV